MLEIAIAAGAAALVYKYGIPAIGIYPGFTRQPKAVTSLQTGKVYALNVLADTSANGVDINNAVIGIGGGASFQGTGKIPHAVKQDITSFPGMDLTMNFNGHANQWLVYVQALQDLALPVQPAATLIIASAFDYNPSADKGDDISAIAPPSEVARGGTGGFSIQTKQQQTARAIAGIRALQKISSKK